MQLSHALAGSEPDELRRWVPLEAEDVFVYPISPRISPYLPMSRVLDAEYMFLYPSQHSRGRVLRGIRPHSAVFSCCVRTPRLHAVL